MISIKTIIIEDEEPARKRLKSLIKQEEQIILVAEAVNGRQGIKMIEEYQPKLIFLDIQLKDMTGFDVLNQVTLKTPVYLIFTTAYDHFAIEAFEKNALDYLLKPFKNERFFKALEKAKHAIKKDRLIHSISQIFHNSKELTSHRQIQEGKTIHNLDTSSLLYVQAAGYHSDLIMEPHTKTIRITLKELQSILPAHFIRFNRSVIINTHKILRSRRLKKTITIEMIDNRIFSSRRDFSDEVKNIL